MKRRAFFRGMFGAVAAPLAIKAAEAMESLPALPEPQPAPAPQPLPAFRPAYAEDYCTGVSYTAADLLGSSCSAYCGNQIITPDEFYNRTYQRLNQLFRDFEKS